MTKRIAPGPKASGEKRAVATACGVDGHDENRLKAPLYGGSYMIKDAVRLKPFICAAQLVYEGSFELGILDMDTPGKYNRSAPSASGEGAGGADTCEPQLVSVRAVHTLNSISRNGRRDIAGYFIQVSGYPRDGMTLAL